MVIVILMRGGGEDGGGMTCHILWAPSPCNRLFRLHQSIVLLLWGRARVRYIQYNNNNNYIINNDVI